MDREIETRELQQAMKKGRANKRDTVKRVPFYSRLSGIVSIPVILTFLVFLVTADDLLDIVPIVFLGLVVMAFLLVKSVRNHRDYWFR